MAETDRPAVETGDGAVDLEVQIVHLSPGRLRLRVRRGALEDQTLQAAERALAGLAGVREVRENPIARSVLIRYDGDAVELAAVLAAVSRAGVTVVPSDRPIQGAGPVTTVDRTDLSKSITTLADLVDRRVADLTGGRADLRTLVPISFAILAVRQALAGQVTAVPWYALAWYAFDSFVKLRRADPPAEPSLD